MNARAPLRSLLYCTVREAQKPEQGADFLVRHDRGHKAAPTEAEFVEERDQRLVSETEVEEMEEVEKVMEKSSAK